MVICICTHCDVGNIHLFRRASEFLFDKQAIEFIFSTQGFSIFYTRTSVLVPFSTETWHKLQSMSARLRKSQTLALSESSKQVFFSRAL
mmetsp:Transcript_55981/g.90667  ORF Transcript_55981/g.90667 Transcript_55981/m.90667 type:complete len:89 (+) Transcript_55981:126-392(+)